MIKEEEVEKAVEWLRTNAKHAAEARASKIYMEGWLKVEKARIMGLFVGISRAAAEDEAMGHPDYAKALEALREAVRADAECTFLREAATARIEAWRTQCSNLRAEGKAYA